MKFIRKIAYGTEFVIFYVSRLIRANFLIAWDILTPAMHINPGFIEYDLQLKKDTGLLLFSNLVSMTPGTLSIDITDSRTKLIVHVLYADQENATRAELDRLQKRIRRITE